MKCKNKEVGWTEWRVFSILRKESLFFQIKYKWNLDHWQVVVLKSEIIKGKCTQGSEPSILLVWDIAGGIGAMHRRTMSIQQSPSWTCSRVIHWTMSKVNEIDQTPNLYPGWTKKFNFLFLIGKIFRLF